MNLLIIALPFLLTLFIVITNLNWRQLVKAVLFIIIFDGVLRKWIFPQISNFIYLLKDLCLICAYLKFFVFSYRQYPLIKNNYISIFHILLGMVSIWLLFQSFNPDLGSPVIGLFGLSRYLLYVPLIWMVPYLFDSEEDFYRFLRNYLLCLIPVCILGIAQFYSPPSSILNVAPGGEEASEALGFGDGKLRISSVFAFPNIYTTYLVINFGLLLPFLTRPEKKSLFWKVAIFSELFLMIANFFMTGSRGVVIFSVLVFFGFLGIKSIDNFKATIKFMRLVAILVVLGMLILPKWFAPAIEAFSSRGNLVDTAVKDDRLRYNISITSIPGKTFSDGYGTGATQSGGKALQRFLNLPPAVPTPPAEAEIHRINIEIGIVGTILWYAMRISLLISLLYVYRTLNNIFLKDTALIALLIHLQLLPSQVVVHPLAVVYYWFLSGFIFLLPQLELKNNYQKQLFNLTT